MSCEYCCKSVDRILPPSDSGIITVSRPILTSVTTPKLGSCICCNSPSDKILSPPILSSLIQNVDKPDLANKLAKLIQDVNNKDNDAVASDLANLPTEIAEVVVNSINLTNLNNLVNQAIPVVKPTLRIPGISSEIAAALPSELISAMNSLDSISDEIVSVANIVAANPNYLPNLVNAVNNQLEKQKQEEISINAARTAANNIDDAINIINNKIENSSDEAIKQELNNIKTQLSQASPTSDISPLLFAAARATSNTLKQTVEQTISDVNSKLEDVKTAHTNAMKKMSNADCPKILIPSFNQILSLFLDIFKAVTAIILLIGLIKDIIARLKNIKLFFEFELSILLAPLLAIIELLQNMINDIISLFDKFKNSFPYPCNSDNKSYKDLEQDFGTWVKNLVSGFALWALNIFLLPIIEVVAIPISLSFSFFGIQIDVMRMLKFDCNYFDQLKEEIAKDIEKFKSLFLPASGDFGLANLWMRVEYVFMYIIDEIVNLLFGDVIKIAKKIEELMDLAAAIQDAMTAPATTGTILRQAAKMLLEQLGFKIPDGNTDWWKDYCEPGIKNAISKWKFEDGYPKLIESVGNVTVPFICGWTGIPDPKTVKSMAGTLDLQTKDPDKEIERLKSEAKNYCKHYNLKCTVDGMKLYAAGIAAGPAGTIAIGILIVALLEMIDFCAFLKMLGLYPLKLGINVSPPTIPTPNVPAF